MKEFGIKVNMELNNKNYKLYEKIINIISNVSFTDWV